MRVVHKTGAAAEWDGGVTLCGVTLQTLDRVDYVYTDIVWIRDILGEPLKRARCTNCVYAYDMQKLAELNI